METMVHIDDGTAFLFLYGKAVDLWIAENGKDCLTENLSEGIPLIAQCLWEDFLDQNNKKDR